jgi:TATA-box binding protein (TBP) (component of TFIID and TFIIIB)
MLKIRGLCLNFERRTLDLHALRKERLQAGTFHILPPNQQSRCRHFIVGYGKQNCAGAKKPQDVHSTVYEIVEELRGSGLRC